MKAKTEELIYHIFWAAEKAFRPSFRNLGESFEGWAYRNGLRRPLAVLARQQLIESQGPPGRDRVHRLTEAGRLLAMGGRDPSERWRRRWDGNWRMVVFDVPQKKASDRTRLRRSLITRGFGRLQDSVWITPDPLTCERDALGGGPADVSSLILLEARPCAGESNEEIVAAAWDFVAIDECYQKYAAVLARLPKKDPVVEAGASRLQEWLREERLAWSEVMGLDPLLPQPLHPPSYSGMKAWQRRLDVMAEAGRQMRAFKRVV